MLALPAAAPAQVSEALEGRLEARLLRQETRLDFQTLKAGDPVTPRRKWDFGIGVAYTDAESGSDTWSTPFAAKLTFEDQRTALKLSGAGFSRVESQNGTVSGANDLNTALAYRLYPKVVDTNDPKPRLQGEAGFTIPTASAVGGAHAKQRIGASLLKPLVQSWTGMVSAKLTRANADPAPGVSRVTVGLLAQASYDFGSAKEITFQLGRSARSGASGTSQATLAYTAPVRPGRKTPTATLGLTRGLTSGATDNTVELDFSWSF